MSNRVVMLLTNDCVSDPRVEKEAVALSSEGWEVVILAWDRSGEAPATEDRDGYRIERIGPRAAYGAGVSSLPAFRDFWKNAAVRAEELRPDVVHCHDLDTAPAGLRVKRMLPGVHLVLDYHEFYRVSRMVPSRGIKGVVARFVVDLLDRYALSRSAFVILTFPAGVDYYERLAPGKVVMVENAPDATFFHPAPGPRPERPFTVCYVGQKRYIDSLRMLVDIVQEHEGLSAILAGGGVAAEEIARYAEGKPRIETTGRVGYAEIPAFYDRSDAVWALYDASVGNIKTAIPVKMMEGMACGLPVLVNAGTWAGDYVMEHGIGFAVDATSRADVEAAVLRLKDERSLAEEMGRKGRQLVDAGMSWQAAAGRLVDAYRAL